MPSPWRRAVILAALACCPAHAAADGRGYAMSVGVGPGVRPGLPGAYRSASGATLPLVSVELAGSRGMWRSLALAGSAAWTPHALDVTTDAGPRTFDFTLYHLAAGPLLAWAPRPELLLAGGLEAALLLARWEAAALGTCGDGCVVIGDASAADDEVHLGAIARARALYVWRGSSARSDDHIGLGVDARVVAVGDHASGIPLAHGVVLVVLAFGQLD